MSNQIERRWGILALAVLMFIVNIILNQINGSKNPFYLIIWMWVGYDAYKANLVSIKTILKVVIFINMGVLTFIIGFMDDKTEGYLGNNKFTILVSFILLMIPKVLIYFYCKSQIAKVSQHHFDSNSIESGNAGRIEDVEIVRSQTKDSIPMAYAYKSEDASLGVESLKSKYQVDDYDLAQASNEIKNKKVNEDIWNFSAAQNNRIDNAKRQYIIMRSQEIAYEKYQNNVKEVITKAHVQDAEKTTIAHNHAPDVTRKTIYEMFNEKNNSYESTKKYTNYANKKSNKLIWCIFIVIIIAVLYFIRNHKIVLFQ